MAQAVVAAAGTAGIVVDASIHHVVLVPVLALELVLEPVLELALELEPGPAVVATAAGFASTQPKLVCLT